MRIFKFSNERDAVQLHWSDGTIKCELVTLLEARICDYAFLWADAIANSRMSKIAESYRNKDDASKPTFMRYREEIEGPCASVIRRHMYWPAS